MSFLDSNAHSKPLDPIVLPLWALYLKCWCFAWVNKFLATYKQTVRSVAKKTPILRIFKFLRFSGHFGPLFCNGRWGFLNPIFFFFSPVECLCKV